MDSKEHAAHLRRAVAQAGLSQQDLATALGVSVRTVVNWVSKTDPNMPRDRDLERLRKLLPGYDDAGDPVEVALRQSELPAWRQSEVLALYQRHIHEDQREQGLSKAK